MQQESEHRPNQGKCTSNLRNTIYQIHLSHQGGSWMFSVWHEISEKSGTFTPADKKLAAVIMVCPEQVIELTIKQLAERAETSEAAIVRFSRKIGLSGYRELKLKLARELDDTHVELDNHKVMLEDSTQVLTQKVFNNAISALARTEKLMNADDLQAAAELISGSSQLLLVESAEMTVMRDFKTKMMTLNKRAGVVTHYNTTGGAHGDKKKGKTGRCRHSLQHSGSHHGTHEAGRYSDCIGRGQ